MKDLIACLYSQGWTFSQLKNLNNQMILPECTGSFFDFCKKHNIKYLVGDEVFLKKTKPLPYVLYYQGNLELLNNKIV
jgi:predicted Rossmann fold nucleotide-binding protein DprA/Smf involved in DNA uptake